MCAGIKDLIPQRKNEYSYDGFEDLIDRCNLWMKERSDIVVVNMQSVIVQKNDGQTRKPQFNCASFVSFYSDEAMAGAVLAVSRCLSVGRSHAGIALKRQNGSSCFQYQDFPCTLCYQGNRVSPKIRILAFVRSCTNYELVKKSEMLSTVNRRPSPVDHTERRRLCTTR